MLKPAGTIGNTSSGLAPRVALPRDGTLIAASLSACGCG